MTKPRINFENLSGAGGGRGGGRYRNGTKEGVKSPQEQLPIARHMLKRRDKKKRKSRAARLSSNLLEDGQKP